MSRRRWLALTILMSAFAGVGAAMAQYHNAMTVTVPAYGAGYGGGADSAVVALKDQLDRIEAKLDKLTRLAEADTAAAAEGVTTKPGTVPPALTSAAQKCAQCHHADVAETKGNGFALFDPDGKFAKIAERDRRRLVSYVKSGKMPPQPLRLTDAERGAILDVFDPPPTKKE